MSRKGMLIKTFLIFILSYLLFLFLWAGIKDSYGQVVTRIASHFIPSFKTVTLKKVERKGDSIKVFFIPNRYTQANIQIDFSVRTLTFTSNAPLTFALMAALFPFLRRKWMQKNHRMFWRHIKVYGMFLSILFGIHILYVLTFEGERLTFAMTSRGFEEISSTKMAFWQVLHGYVHHVTIRFELFLIGFFVYFYLKFSSSSLKWKKDPKLVSQ